MDDLLNLEWPSSNNPAPPQSNSQTTTPFSFSQSTTPGNPGSTKTFNNANLFQPSSGRPASTLNQAPPQSRPAINLPTATATTTTRPPASKPQSTATKPLNSGNDSFASLLSIGGGSGLSSSKATGSKMSLQDRQRLMEEEKKRSMKQHADAFSGIGEGLLDRSFGIVGKPGPAPSLAQTSGYKSPAPGLSVPASQPMSKANSSTGRNSEDLDDILAAFDSAAPVDARSHLPPPTGKSSSPRSDVSGFAVPSDRMAGLDISKSNSSHSHSQSQAKLSDFDDFITFPDIGSPPVAVSPRLPDRSRTSTPDEFIHIDVPEKANSVPEVAEDEWTTTPKSSDPRDRAVAELVDMGFEASVAATALGQTQSGCDVSAAVAIILNQVHRETTGQSGSGVSPQAHTGPGRGPPGGDYSWAFSSQKAPAQVVSELGTSFMNSANSLWKVGQKHLKQAVAELQAPGPLPNQPRWMAESTSSSALSHRHHRHHDRSEKVSRHPSGLTDEAIVLGIRDDETPKRQSSKKTSGNSNSNSNNPFVSASAKGAPPPPPPARSGHSRKTKLTRQEVEQESATMYRSSARRRPVPSPPAKDRSEQPAGSLFDMDDERGLVGNTSPGTDAPPKAKPKPASRRQSPPRPAPAVPQRTIPPVSHDVLATSASHRLAGNDSFKLGDFDAAHTAFTRSLTVLPSTHPLTIVVLCNRAAAALKIGNPHGAISDADSALDLIGPSGGKNETIEIVDGRPGSATTQPPVKGMREYFGRALQRKAQALEQLERWKEAGEVWQRSIEAGVGGPVELSGRTRCLEIVSKSTTRSSPSASSSSSAPPVSKPKTRSQRTAAADVIRAGEAASAAAVQRRRDADKKATDLEDEKFRLQDSVDARISTWAGQPGQGRGENLRALLASLDNVLWPNSGWKPVGMAGLVLPQKVKISYMKALTIVHPDKLPPTATTEHGMLAGSVFAILNSAWDKFKAENGM